MSSVTPSNAIVTASYAPDFDRCAILCETIDKHVTGYDKHYILVAESDASLFRSLEGPTRMVVGERDILPAWLRSFPDPLKFGRRSVWLSLRALPLHGWQVQQLRRIAIADHVPEEGLMFCDSDTAFVRPYDLGSAWRDDRLRLYRQENGLSSARDDHAIWVRNAAAVLGVENDRMNGHDYVGTMIHWRAGLVRAMCRHIESASGRHWLAAMGRSRKFSECMLYGHFVDDVLGGEGHYHDPVSICRMGWFAPPPSEAELGDWIRDLSPGQVAIGIQSFLPFDEGAFKRIIGI